MTQWISRSESTPVPPPLYPGANGCIPRIPIENIANFTHFTREMHLRKAPTIEPVAALFDVRQAGRENAAGWNDHEDDHYCLDHRLPPRCHRQLYETPCEERKKRKKKENKEEKEELRRKRRIKKVAGATGRKRRRQEK